MMMPVGPLLPAPAAAGTARAAAAEPKLEAGASPVKLEPAAVVAGGAVAAPSSTLSPEQQARIAASREAALARRKAAAAASGQSHA